MKIYRCERCCNDNSYPLVWVTYNTHIMECKHNHIVGKTKIIIALIIYIKNNNYVKT